MNILKGGGSYRRPGPRRLKGHGGYAEDFGSKIGGWLGGKAGGFLSNLFGFGEYKVNKNSLMQQSGTAPNDPPLVTNTSGATRIQHREYIQDIVGSSGFTIQTFPVQPGISTTFPWLSCVSQAFEEYILHGILFEFKSTSADALNSTNTALGTVIMATEYNPLHGPFTGKRDMENYVYSTSSPPSVSALHPIECARDVTVLSELFIRNVPLTGADLRFSDLGLFQIATVGMQASATIGELWVTYDVELIKPKLPDAYSSVGPAHYVYSLGTLNPNPQNGVPTQANLFGTLTSQKFQLLGTGVSPVTLEASNIMRFQQTGRYFVSLNINSGTAWTAAAPVLFPVGAATLLPLFHVGATTAIQFSAPEPGDTINSAELSFVIEILPDTSNVKPYITIDLGSFTAGAPAIDIWVMPLPAGFSTPKVNEIDQFRNELQQLRLTMKSIIEDHEDEKGYDQTDLPSPSLPKSNPVLTRTKPNGTPLDLSDSTINIARLIKNQFG